MYISKPIVFQFRIESKVRDGDWEVEAFCKDAVQAFEDEQRLAWLKGNGQREFRCINRRSGKVHL